MEEVPCKKNPKLFFPSPARWDGHQANDVGIQQAKRLCGVCHNRIPCLNIAVEAKENYGIWGGVHFGNPRERNVAIRSRSRVSNESVR